VISNHGFEDEKSIGVSHKGVVTIIRIWYARNTLMLQELHSMKLPDAVKQVSSVTKKLASSN